MERNLTTPEVIAKAKKAIAENKRSRVYLHLAGITFGRFVMLQDFEETLSKGYLRFLHETQAQNFEAAESNFKKEGMTKLLMIEKICDILNF